MYDRQLPGSNQLLMPFPSPALHPAAQPLAIMSANRSDSPASSRGSGNNDISTSPHNPQSPDSHPDGTPNKGRALSTSKRAEQNRRAQRAFRERRDARFKSLEQRAVLLDEALQKAEEANRRWEECRVLVDQLRHENAMLRTSLEDAGINADNIPTTLPHTNGHTHDIYDDLSHEHTNGVDGHTTIVIEEAGPAKKRRRREEGDMEPRVAMT